jgi:hypothetical protein
MTPVKPQMSTFQADKKWALTCYGGSTYERLLNESSRPYRLAYYLIVYVLLMCIG